MKLSILLSVLPLQAAGLVMPFAKRAEPAPLLLARGDTALPNKYIIKLKSSEGGASNAADVPASVGVEPKHLYDRLIKGFSATLNAEELAALRDHPEVEFIEQDSEVKISEFVTQPNATWGISRMSHRKPHATDYVYDSSAGEGTCAFILDTGINPDLAEFEGRAKMLKSYVDGEPTDGHGHGTHVAGTIGSKTFGLAKKTKLYGVKVLNNAGTGPWSDVIAGLELVGRYINCTKCPKGVVVNMSLAGKKIDTVNQAAKSLVEAGAFLGVAAGNFGDDAANWSPASEPSVCTVAASTADDTMPYWSNFGELVDVFAPGASINSTWFDGTTHLSSGTSMASPHVVGLAAYLGALEGIKGGAICDRIKELATKDVITELLSPNTPNLLAFNGNPSG
ncbi:proteinase T precursor [Purpureocillium lilacinum]|uniref:Proteinase T n=2 Tax=Purpureocillium lilacinum TaxID=33203 RepID=A0A179GIZ5_PURLI|nr:proteinase T precursor [Purpureocillium lilacinum]KAK4086215.1 hypothetical protein Purlil1_9527 [Purpureocillium lilacinum]OAQ77498.1 proteinase T precursor [Purpureocillium lilacinum]OAQ85490.1 proteinase T precursor [Purpureocillium lilacinum]